jgi:CheY-like chemotaxis protein/GNAT superfamily N-acetyltransferase
MSSDPVVYIVDIDSSVREALCGLLGAYGIRVQPYADTQSFLLGLHASKSESGCLLLSLDLPDENGLSLLKQLRSEDYRFPIIVLATETGGDLRQQIKDAGATELVDKYLVDTYIVTRFSEILPDAPRLPITPDSTMELSDGTQVTFRMVHPEDAGLQQEFIVALSENSRYMRFFSGIKELPPSMLEKLTNLLFPSSYALMATICDGEDERQIGVARYAPTETPGAAEFAVVVADEWQGFGIASQLLRGIITAAAAGGIDRLEGLVLRENAPMLKLMLNMGFVESPGESPEPSAVLVAKELPHPGDTNPNALPATPINVR